MRVNSGTPTEKVSEFLDHHLKPIMQEGWSSSRILKIFLKKIQKMQKIPQGSILVAADVTGLYPNMPFNAVLEALKNKLDCRQNKKILLTDVLVQMTEFLFNKGLSTNNFCYD